MGRLGLPVPPGFTISTEVCHLFYQNKKKKLSTKLIKEINKELHLIEKEIQKEIWRFKRPIISLSQIWG